MPNRVSNSTSVSTPTNDEQAISNTTNSVGENHANSANSHNWYYGTEELLDALPRRWTRSLLYFMVIFSAIALPWTMLSQVDETGSARGRIEPLGETQRLDTPVGGNIIAVKVKEGETVKAGQLLVELESNVLRTDLQQAQAKLDGLINRLAQLELLKNQLKLAISVQEQQNQSQELEKVSQVNQAQQNLDAKQSTYNLQKLEKLALVDQAKQNMSSTQTAYKLAKSRWDRDLTETKRYRLLWQKGAVPQIKVVELEKIAEESQRVNEQTQSDIKQAKLRFQEEENRYQSIIRQAQADIEQAKLRLQEQKSSYKSVVHAGEISVLKNQEQLKDMQTQITSLSSEIAQTKSQIASIKLQLTQRLMKSPIDGVIFNLPFKKPGVVVQTGQTIAQIAPKKIPFVLKANMPSQESGFLKVGMAAKVKFDAYPFQDYGVVTGKVIRMSPDSKILETPQGKIEVFEMEISLNQSGNKPIPLTPGQTATAEVIVRQRRVIDFILDPFKKLQKGGLDL
ncbi:HlyD family secretion protein [Tolypothrix sp. NIES-4075]|uniref:HlyD family efflux transporter periplasmic adaptor subunit n=1 Tax=Tolypothrix sp. NIES-4075 TaxID=2005459 RepID=UPI000B5CC6B6|nr:HlyD family efflux transporter periplasmic adaptor subunit [Tolypothrix sp. NIES-4075]GAX44798.1 HlyD family secretion protein [Tolypothrix sp. NIES-4075]